MNKLQLIMVMHDLEASIKHNMRLANPRDLNRLKREYKEMLGLPRNTKDVDFYVALWDCAILPNKGAFTESFVNHCEKFIQENYEKI